MRLINVATFVVALAVAAAAPAVAGKGANGNGNGDGHAAAPSGSCTVSGNVVTGTALPTNQVLNFMMTASGVTSGWVLGFSDGTWAVEVPGRSGPTTYEFASRTWGPDGSKYTVFASCSA